MCSGEDSIFNIEYVHRCAACDHRWTSKVFGERCPVCGSIFVVPDPKQ